MILAKYIDMKNKNSFIGGVAIRPKRDASADSLDRLWTSDLCESLLQLLRRETLLSSAEGKVACAQKCQHGIIRENNFTVGTSVAIVATRMLSIGVERLRVFSEK